MGIPASPSASPSASTGASTGASAAIAAPSEFERRTFAKIAWRLLQKKLGFRMLMDVVPLDATLVKGSHGRRPADKKDWPVFITGRPEFLGTQPVESTDVFQILLRHLGAP